MPRVSVIVPIYGVERYIEQCARSLFAQTLEDMEFIFIDDCTKDRSMEVLAKVMEECRERFEEMRWTVRRERMERNSGLPAVRRRGVELASGEYIVHCDSDDWTDRDMYRLMYEKAHAEGLDAVFCDHYRAVGSGQWAVGSEGDNDYDNDDNQHVRTFPWVEIDKQRAFDSMYADNQGYHSLWSAMYRATLYGKVSEFPRNNMGEDTALTAQLLYFARTVGYIPQPLYYYRQREGSIVQTLSVEKRWENVRQLMQNQELIIRFFEQQQVEERYIVFAKLTARFALEGLRKERGFREAWKSCYPEIGRRIVCNKDIRLGVRVKFFLLDSGLHRVIYKRS